MSKRPELDLNPGTTKRPRRESAAIKNSPQSPAPHEKEKVRGRPPAWAEDRPSLCDTLTWFRAFQSGTYFTELQCHGFLLDGYAGVRDYIDDEIVITRVGGDSEKDDDGSVKLKNSQDESTRPVKAMLGSQTNHIAVGLIVGSRCETIKRQLPHRFNVMGWFRIVDIWFETTNSKSTARVRFQKLNLDQPSWWAKEGSQDPLPLSERNLVPIQSQKCGTCQEYSKVIYEQGWVCLQPYSKCTASGLLPDGRVPANLTYSADFLNSREPADSNVKPRFNLVPDILNELSQNPDSWTHKSTTRGVVCPNCQRCISRRYWNGWVCNDPKETTSNIPGNRPPCDWKMWINMPTVSIQTQKDDAKTLHIKQGIVNAGEQGTIQQQTRTTGAYNITTYTIANVGTITHFRASELTRERPKGPDDLFDRLQKVDLGLYRYSLFTRVGNNQLTRHFAANYGMPYKFVVSVDSKGFSEAPAEIMFALGRLTWATEQAVNNEKPLAPNEMLVVGYLEDMAMGFHDDGEDSLGPTIASLSLGATAIVRIRLKNQYFRGQARRLSNALEDIVLPGCANYEQRMELKSQYADGELGDEAYIEQRKELQEQVKRREPPTIITMELQHGDMMVMHGAALQKYYEHSVVSEGKLRYALTARHVKPEKVEMTDHAKGSFSLTPDQVYDGR